ncbi:MAG: hypothetical protein QOD98_71, partial [Nocardioidaceae bacterium]|nr:hypothetical protein [Nocardioidaceae bacterium]
MHEDNPPGGSVGLRVVPAATSGSEGMPPARALEAYQRAATVLEDADPACGLSWPLRAAIGSIESDHGRVDGTVLAPDGVAHPP